MQYDPSKITYKNQNNMYANQYPPVNQPQFGARNSYQPYPGPPSYSQYPQQPIIDTGYTTPGVQYYAQSSPYQQQPVAFIPMYRSFRQTRIATIITSNFRAFLIISGIIFLLWGISIIGLDIAIIFHSYWRLYQGLWVGGFILGTGISMLIAACQVSHHIIYLVRVFIIALVICILGTILSLINFSTSTRCVNAISYRCDEEITSILKMVILIVLCIATGHAIINLIVVSQVRKRAMLTPPTSIVPTYQR